LKRRCKFLAETPRKNLSEGHDWTKKVLAMLPIMVGYRRKETIMPRRNINLTEHFNDFVERQVSSGRYSNASEIVREALGLL
jgi:hypothetical protein